MSQHFGTAESYAQANIQGSPNPQPNEVWWIQLEEDTGNGVVGRGCWNWGDRFCSFVPHDWARSKRAAQFKQT